jgi:hypothetical protein
MGGRGCARHGNEAKALLWSLPDDVLQIAMRDEDNEDEWAAQPANDRPPLRAPSKVTQLA